MNAQPNSLNESMIDRVWRERVNAVKVLAATKHNTVFYPDDSRETAPNIESYLTPKVFLYDPIRQFKLKVCCPHCIAKANEIANNGGGRGRKLEY